MLITYTPEQSAEHCMRSLRDAHKALAEAQVAVAEAASTVAMFETNFRSGHYTQKKDPTLPPTTIEEMLKVEKDAVKKEKKKKEQNQGNYVDGLCPCGLDMFKAPEQHGNQCPERLENRK